MEITAPRAKELPGLIKIIDQTDIDQTLEEARLHPKRRTPILLHRTFSEIPQRYVNCITKNTYVRPHNHILINNWELMSWISGIIYVFFFDCNGKIINKIKMSEDGIKVIEIPPDIYHTFTTPDYGVYLGIRNCTYEPDFDSTYATWAPPCTHSYVSLFLEKLIHAEENDTLLTNWRATEIK